MYKFTFSDGYTCWACGMSARERKVEESKHGKLIKKERA